MSTKRKWMGEWSVRGLVLVLVSAAFAVVGADVAVAQIGGEKSAFSVGGGIGFQVDENFEAFQLVFDGLYHYDQNFSIGTEFEFGFEEDAFLFSLPILVRYDTDPLGSLPVRLFANTGIGLTHVDPDGSDDSDTGFLWIIGGGLAYDLSESLAIESKMQFHVNTNDAFEDDFYFSWRILGARFKF